jgi:hypothetical protein
MPLAEIVGSSVDPTWRLEVLDQSKRRRKAEAVSLVLAERRTTMQYPVRGIQCGGPSPIRRCPNEEPIT